MHICIHIYVYKYVYIHAHIYIYQPSGRLLPSGGGEGWCFPPPPPNKLQGTHIESTNGDPQFQPQILFLASVAAGKRTKGERGRERQ